jgi:hypothetical protein
MILLKITTFSERRIIDLANFAITASPALVLSPGFRAAELSDFESAKESRDLGLSLGPKLPLLSGAVHIGIFDGDLHASFQSLLFAEWEAEIGVAM